MTRLFLPEAADIFSNSFVMFHANCTQMQNFYQNLITPLIRTTFDLSGFRHFFSFHEIFHWNTKFVKLIRDFFFRLVLMLEKLLRVVFLHGQESNSALVMANYI